jgi:hypothetical protein
MGRSPLDDVPQFLFERAAVRFCAGAMRLDNRVRDIPNENLRHAASMLSLMIAFKAGTAQHRNGLKRTTP